MILGQLNPLENRRIIGRAPDHFPDFGAALVGKMRIGLSKGRHFICCLVSDILANWSAD